MALSRLSNQELRTVHALIHAETIDRMMTGAMSSGNAKREIGAIDANDHASEATVAEDDADSVVTAAATAMDKSWGDGVCLKPRKKSPPVLPARLVHRQADQVSTAKSPRPSRPRRRSRRRSPSMASRSMASRPAPGPVREKIKRQRESSSSPVLSPRTAWRRLSLMRPGTPPPRTWERESMSDDSL